MSRNIRIGVKDLSTSSIVKKVRRYRSQEQVGLTFFDNFLFKLLVDVWKLHIEQQCHTYFG